jgi:hypothetical protein
LNAGAVSGDVIGRRTRSHAAPVFSNNECIARSVVLLTVGWLVGWAQLW